MTYANIRVRFVVCNMYTRNVNQVELYLDPLEQHTSEAWSELPDMVQGQSTKINDDNDTGNLGARLEDCSFQTDEHPSKQIRQRTLLGLPFVYKYQDNNSYSIN